jgi:hypothetical protein
MGPARPHGPTARTSVIIAITGAVLTFAVTGHPSFLDIRLTGAILMAAGVAGLWPRDGRARLVRASTRLRQLLTEMAPPQGVRVPFDELFGAGPPVRQPASQAAAGRDSARRPNARMFGRRTRGTNSRGGCRQARRR